MSVLLDEPEGTDIFRIIPDPKKFSPAPYFIKGYRLSKKVSLSESQPHQLLLHGSPYKPSLRAYQLILPSIPRKVQEILESREQRITEAALTDILPNKEKFWAQLVANEVILNPELSLCFRINFSYENFERIRRDIRPADKIESLKIILFDNNGKAYKRKMFKSLEFSETEVLDIENLLKQETS
jgi:hypothetical protein